MISLTFSMHFALFMIYAKKVGTLCIFFFLQRFCFKMIYLYADNINRVNLSMSEKNAPSKDQKAKLHVVNDKRFKLLFL